jgi:repressor LexA
VGIDKAPVVPLIFKVLMIQLSVMQQKIYERLRGHFKHTGVLPDLAGFARSLGMHYVSLKQHLEALHKKGYLTFESRGRGRSPLLSLPAEATGIPVLGNIPAGPISEAVPHAEGYLPFAGLSGDHFALRVQGNSMADLIQDNDVVLFEKREPYRSGEICAVRVEDNEVTLKYLDKLEEHVCALRPHNSSYPTLKVTAGEFHIEGVYLGLLRGDAFQLLVQ